MLASPGSSKVAKVDRAMTNVIHSIAAIPASVRALLILACTAFALTGCATNTELTTYDFSQRTGLYVLGYTTDESVRRTMEKRVVADLAARDMVGFASYEDLPNLTQTNRSAIISAANDKKAVAVLVINQVVPGEGGLLENPLRISPDHPDLQAFYTYTKSLERQPNPTNQVFAEVNAFLIEGDNAKLVWSGTTWSFRADGKGGAIPGISSSIAEEVSHIRDVLRPESVTPR
jgi:hypothetical protein